MRLVIIGGGAAGIFCAINAARMNNAAEVIVVEKTGKLLSKVRISGGGRCNVTHACFSIPDITKKYPRGGNFVKKAFHQFFTEDTIAWFNDRGVHFKTESDGRMFPVTDSSETIINCLLREADKYKVQIKMNREVKSIINDSGKWKIIFASNEELMADKICVACGGYPKDSMFEWLINTGHTIESPVPSLFTFNMPGNNITGLMGIATNAIAKIQSTKLEEQGPILITHWGLSGPAVLKLSARGARELHAMNYRFNVIINWCPAFNEQSVREEFLVLRSSSAAQKVKGKNFFCLPHRLWEYLCELSEVGENVRWAELTSVQQNKLAKYLCTHELKVEGKTTFKEEFVTAGGIRLSEIDPNTMQTRRVPGLYFAGEIIDVDGVTGGFNFQHAWTSGWIAAKNLVIPEPSEARNPGSLNT
jgi:predicted Rossmann fold flavoprotein